MDKFVYEIKMNGWLSESSPIELSDLGSILDQDDFLFVMENISKYACIVVGNIIILKVAKVWLR